LGGVVEERHVDVALLGTEVTILIVSGVGQYERYRSQYWLHHLQDAASGICRLGTSHCPTAARRATSYTVLQGASFDVEEEVYAHSPAPQTAKGVQVLLWLLAR